jgi:hypothetical protein
LTTIAARLQLILHIETKEDIVKRATITIQGLLQSHINERQISPAQLAREMGVSRQRLASWLGGHRRPAVDLLLTLITTGPQQIKELAIALLRTSHPQAADALEMHIINHNDYENSP